MFPSNIAESPINIGPENKPNQATSANGFISLLNGFTKTCPRAQTPDPIITKVTPKNFPSKLGDPVKIYTPINAIAIPIRAFTVGFSLSIK